MKYDDLYFEVSKYIKDQDKLDIIKKAYLFAFEHHKDKFRKNGDLYIEHPLNVAYILTDLKADYETISAALLHETINHGGATKEEIEEIFGEDIADLVDSISKINRLSLSDDKQDTAINLRKVLVGISQDVRVLFIKLADRLHNMRTIYALSIEEKKEKIHETESVLIPIAHRLGINTIKSELEDLCLRYSKPEEYQEIYNKLNDSTNLSNRLDEMKKDISDILSSYNINFTIKGRVKSVHSVYNKMVNGHTWDQIYDILALRVIVDNISDCYLAIGLIHAKYKPMNNRFKDYIAMPKSNMYQSLHTTIYGKDNYVFEVQIRTKEMDDIAERGFASHWSYKEGKETQNQNVMEQKLELFRNLIEQNSDNISDLDFEKSINNEALSQMIYCFTPKGDVVELPNNSTPIDFAYRIHSKVGDTTVGCLINNKIAPLNSKLQDGDMVSIKTLASSKPSKEWLNFVVTSQAKNKIKSFFSKQDKEFYTEKGKNILEKELRRRKLSINEALSNEKVSKICNDLKLNDLNDLYLSIGSLRYTAGYIVNLLYEDKKNVEDILLEKVSSSKKMDDSNRLDVIVSGTDEIKINLAKCCKPIKGDSIVGFITMGQGITVHRSDCPNIKDENERIIEVKWNDNITNEYYTDIIIEMDKNTNHLMDIVSLASSKNINVEAINNHENDLTITYYMTLKIKDIDNLNSLIGNLTSLPYIKKIERIRS